MMNSGQFICEKSARAIVNLTPNAFADGWQWWCCYFFASPSILSRNEKQKFPRME